MEHPFKFSWKAIFHERCISEYDRLVSDRNSLYKHYLEAKSRIQDLEEKVASIPYLENVKKGFVEYKLEAEAALGRVHDELREAYERIDTLEGKSKGKKKRIDRAKQSSEKAFIHSTPGFFGSKTQDRKPSKRPERNKKYCD